MLEQYLLPPLLQFDDGFGSTAEGFQDAAKSLARTRDRGLGLSGTRLPIYYLYRHAIELFLKGCIIILHRRFHPDFPDGGSDSYPTVADGNRDRKLFHIHDLGLLYSTFKDMIHDNAAELARS